MKTLSHVNKKELLHELFAANAQFLYSLKSTHPCEMHDRRQARKQLNAVLQEVERRKNILSDRAYEAQSLKLKA